MAFVKKTWKDRISEYPNRRTINDGNLTKVVTVGRDEGNITQAGDAFNASNMNDLEDRIEAGLAEKPDREEVEDMVEGFFPLDEASGAMVSINPGVMLPLRYCECQINAYQASGTPTPVSPLPITGFSQADIVVCGKNLFNQNNFTHGLPSTTIGADINTITATTRYSYTDFIAPKTNCIIKATTTQSIFTVVYLFGYSGGKLSHYEYFYATGSGATKQIDFSLYDHFRIAIGDAGSGGTMPTDLDGYGTIQIEVGSVASDFVAYKGNLYTVAFGQTIYGGRLIYENGEWSIEATFNIVDNATIPIQKNSGSADDYMYYMSLSNHDRTALDKYMCSHVKRLTSLPTGTTQGFIFANAYNVLYFNMGAIADNTSSGMRQYLIDNNVQFVYPLETPVIIPITSSTRIKTIFGENNIYHDCNGDIDVIYHKALTAKNIYFDNSGTTLTATNVEDAIKEVLGRI